MNSRIFRGIISLAIFLVPGAVSGFSGQAQSSQPAPARHGLPDALVARIPAAYRQEVRSLLAVTEGEQQYLATTSDEELTEWSVEGLAANPDGQNFLLVQLDREGSPELRSTIIRSMEQYWESHPKEQGILERYAASDPDVAVSLQALETLRSIRMSALDGILESRITAAKSARDADALKSFGSMEERWFSLKRGVMLPAFLRVPPPVFSVVPRDKPVRVVAFGDFGTGSEAQKQTAAAILKYSKDHPLDFGITLGDNFYPYGMTATSDPRWQTQWEQLYGPLGIKFYAVLGNHDWVGPDSPAAEILYSARSRDWKMPSPYYTYTAGPVQFFAFDTVEDSEAELEWLDSELSKSTARWKVVYGHYHIFSATRGDNNELIERLLPLLQKHHVDVYLNGHDHNLQELKPEGGVHFFVSGGGGATLYDLNPYDRSVYKKKVNGFTILDADRGHFKVSFIGTDGKEMYEKVLTKEP